MLLVATKLNATVGSVCRKNIPFELGFEHTQEKERERLTHFQDFMEWRSALERIPTVLFEKPLLHRTD